MRALGAWCTAAGIVVLSTPAPAHACSPPPCWPGSFSPADGASVPASLPAIRWHPMLDVSGTTTFAPTSVVLATQAAPQAPIALTATALPDGDYLLVPTAPLSPGEVYTLTDHSVCPGGGVDAPHATFRTGAAVPLPTQLGTLTATPMLGPLAVATPSGSCTTDITAASAQIALAPAIDAQPWSDALFYRTLVDGQPWSGAHSIRDAVPPGASWDGRGVDLVYHLCETSDAEASAGIAAGPHVIAMDATLPGANVTLSTAPVMIDLECQPPSGTGTGTGSPGGCQAGGARGALPGVLGALAVRRRRRR
jgi:hypothetical protein